MGTEGHVVQAVASEISGSLNNQGEPQAGRGWGRVLEMGPRDRSFCFLQNATCLPASCSCPLHSPRRGTMGPGTVQGIFIPSISFKRATPGDAAYHPRPQQEARGVSPGERKSSCGRSPRGPTPQRAWSPSDWPFRRGEEPGGGAGPEPTSASRAQNVTMFSISRALPRAGAAPPRRQAS